MLSGVQALLEKCVRGMYLEIPSPPGTTLERDCGREGFGQLEAIVRQAGMATTAYYKGDK